MTRASAALTPAAWSVRSRLDAIALRNPAMRAKGSQRCAEKVVGPLALKTPRLRRLR